MALEYAFVSAKSIVVVVSVLCCIVAIFFLSTTAYIVNVDHHLEATTASHKPPPPSSLSCKDLGHQIEHLQHPFEFNSFRRLVALEHATCMEKLFSKFANAFESRIGMKKQYNLHIPKTGGTSLCDLARLSNFTAAANNCHGVSLGPYWCCVDEQRNGPDWAKPISCEAIQDSEFDFIANERWLDDTDDFCDDVAYSITIREPVSRAMSQMHHYLTAFVSRATPEIKSKRLHRIQSNYMTWSLVSGALVKDDPTSFWVQPEHLRLAKQTLSRFDFILEIGGDHTSEPCLALILEYMGMTHTLPHSRKSKKANYSSFYPMQQYETLNAIDTELYRYAQELIQADCEFFHLYDKRLKGQ